MSEAYPFERLVVWQEARALAGEIWRITEQRPLAQDWTLRDQMRRAANSVTANIAEGWDRSRTKELLHYLRIAKASCAELRSHIHLASDVGYLDKKTYEDLVASTHKVGGLIGRLWLTTKRRPNAT